MVPSETHRPQFLPSTPPISWVPSPGSYRDVPGTQISLPMTAATWPQVAVLWPRFQSAQSVFDGFVGQTQASISVVLP